MGHAHVTMDISAPTAPLLAYPFQAPLASSAAAMEAAQQVVDAYVQQAIQRATGMANYAILASMGTMALTALPNV